MTLFKWIYGDQFCDIMRTTIKLDNVESLVSSLLNCYVLGAPDGTLRLSQTLKSRHVFIGTVNGASLLIDSSYSVLIHSVTYSRRSMKSSTTKDKGYRIVFYPPGASFPIDKIRKKKLSLEEAAGVIGISLRHLFRLIANGDFKPSKKGRRKFLGCKDVLHWVIKSGRIGNAPYLISGE